MPLRWRQFVRQHRAEVQVKLGVHAAHFVFDRNLLITTSFAVLIMSRLLQNDLSFLKFPLFGFFDALN